MSIIDPVPASEEPTVRSIQEREFPEGAPPPRRTRQRQTVIALVCITAIAVASFVALFLIGGTAALAVGVAMALAYGVLGGATAVLGVMERTRVRREIRERLQS